MRHTYWHLLFSQIPYINWLICLTLLKNAKYLNLSSKCAKVHQNEIKISIKIQFKDLLILMDRPIVKNNYHKWENAIGVKMTIPKVVKYTHLENHTSVVENENTMMRNK